MRSLYALHLSLSIAIPAIQPRLRLPGTNRLRSAFHNGQRRKFLFYYECSVQYLCYQSKIVIPRNI
ncbi:MAG: hypothetical protein KZQ63_14900 [Candidatus Thiodiazotropha sp. (ex Lucinoma aequizonata)]|nr:hypothetical protein [Candidatus Thiodiazotropha sp. (ex Lucinoma aequizonata)]